MTTRSQPGLYAIHLLVGVVCMLVVVRTWFVLGLLEPVLVSGSSMAPALRGTEVVATCGECGRRYAVAAEFAPARARDECPRCGKRKLYVADLPVTRGDRLWIDRVSLQFRAPRRWEPLVFCSVDDGGQLAVKRVVGLPGEAIAVRDGDVWADGRLVRKRLADQRAVRQLMHRESAHELRWRPSDEDQDWQWHRGRWQCSASGANQWRWLKYIHPSGPVTDATPYNAGASQRLHPVRDLLLAAEVQCPEGARFAIDTFVTDPRLRLILDPMGGDAKLFAGSDELVRAAVTEATRQQLAEGQVLVEVSTFDGHFLLAIGGEEVLHVPWAHLQLAQPGASPFALGSLGAGVAVVHLALYRDAYYGQAVPCPAVRLGMDQYYVLGDNAAISVDSRRWGPLPGRLLTGRPLGSR